MDRYKRYNNLTDTYEYIDYDDIEKGDILLVYSSYQHESPSWLELIAVSVRMDSKGEKIVGYAEFKEE